MVGFKGVDIMARELYLNKTVLKDLEENTSKYLISECRTSS